MWDNNFIIFLQSIRVVLSTVKLNNKKKATLPKNTVKLRIISYIKHRELLFYDI